MCLLVKRYLVAASHGSCYITSDERDGLDYLSDKCTGRARASKAKLNV